MITQVFKSAINYFNAVNSEVMYWKQVDELQRELELTNDALSSARENEEMLERENFELTDENKALKEEVQLFKDSYNSLLKDYYSMVDRHREFKRESLAKIEELQSKVLEVSI